jgi:hypothetical protein
MPNEQIAEQGPSSSGRRNLLTWLIRGFLSLWGLGAAAVGVSFLRAPKAEERPSEGRVNCGPFSSLEIGEARFIRHGSAPLIVLRASETEAQAFSAICTPLRCVLKRELPLSLPRGLVRPERQRRGGAADTAAPALRRGGPLGRDRREAPHVSITEGLLKTKMRAEGGWRGLTMAGRSR